MDFQRGMVKVDGTKSKTILHLLTQKQLLKKVLGPEKVELQVLYVKFSIFVCTDIDLIMF